MIFLTGLLIGQHMGGLSTTFAVHLLSDCLRERKFLSHKSVLLFNHV